MNYPLISEYIEAIKSAEDNFEELSYLRPVLGDDGMPLMSVGNFAVVFKMTDYHNNMYAVKCFIKEQEGRADAYREIAKELEAYTTSYCYQYLTSIKYFDKELYVDTDQTSETEFPVLLMDWIEGKTLDKYLRENLNDLDTLKSLAYRFSLLAQWILSQPFAHGDLKPDNIIVREDGSLVLVDYDGMYVPSMKGQKARELGSPDFRHPQRSEDDFDEHIDDFPLVSILLSLKSLSINPLLLKEFGAADRLLLSKNDYCDIEHSPFLKSFFPCSDRIANYLMSLFVVCLYKKKMDSEMLGFLWKEINNYLSKLVLTDNSDKYVDGCGTEYSKDKKRLYKIGCVSGLGYGYSGNIEYVSYEIEDKIRIICNNAFDGEIQLPPGYLSNNSLLSELSIDGVIAIGDYAFRGRSFLWYVDIPADLIYIGKDPFALTEHLYIRKCFSPHFFLDTMALYSKEKEVLIHVYNDHYFWYRVPDEVKAIGDYSFSRKFFNSAIYHYISLPDSIEKIGDYAFMNCNVCEIRLPKNLKSLGKEIFRNCSNLREIRVPVDSYDLYWNLLPNYRNILVEEYTPNIQDLLIKDILDKYLGDDEEFESYSAAWEAGKHNIINVKVTKYDLSNAWVDRFGVKYSLDKKRLLEAPIENNILESNKMLIYSYDIVQGTNCICDNAFFNCRSLVSIQLPNSIKSIGSRAFFNCRSLSSVNFNYGLEWIGDEAFKDCKNLNDILIPLSLSYIGVNAFEGSGLKTIFTSCGDKKRVESLLPNYKHIIEELPF